MRTKREHVFTCETTAKDARRIYITRGYQVSLVAYDTNRSAYVFDSWK